MIFLPLNHVLRSLTFSYAWYCCFAFSGSRTFQAMDDVMVGGYTKPKESNSTLWVAVGFLFTDLLDTQIFLKQE
jgi:hypothetical protein